MSCSSSSPTTPSKATTASESKPVWPGGRKTYEKSNPHPEDKRWGLAEQTIGNYYWGSNFIIWDLDILNKFDRLDFALPVLL